MGASSEDQLWGRRFPLPIIMNERPLVAAGKGRRYKATQQMCVNPVPMSRLNGGRLASEKGTPRPVKI